MKYLIKMQWKEREIKKKTFLLKFFPKFERDLATNINQSKVVEEIRVARQFKAYCSAAHFSPPD